MMFNIFVLTYFINVTFQSLYLNISNLYACVPLTNAYINYGVNIVL